MNRPLLQPHERDAARQLIRSALHEDLQGSCEVTIQDVPGYQLITSKWSNLRGDEDVTTRSLVHEGDNCIVRVVARQPGVLSGNEVASMVFAVLDDRIDYHERLQDGDPLIPGSVIAEIAGPARSLLTGERTALNFLTLLSGTATLTRKFVDAVAGTEARILDTRKTLPGLRALQRYAVRCGGGINHRFGLYDAILIKDNHLAWWTATTGRGIADAVCSARIQGTGAEEQSLLLEIEVDTCEQLEEVLPAAPDIVLLDNMTEEQMRAAVSLRDRVAPRVLLEASGGITLDRAAAIAATGVDRISIGGLTHSAPALDIGFDWVAH